MDISLYIDRLILDGLTIPPGQHGLLQAAVEAELARLIAASGLAPDLASGVAMPSLRAGSMPMSQDNNPAQLGQQIARAVYAAIGA